MNLADIELLPGIVINASDPKHIGRVKCNVPTLFDTSVMNEEGLPWIYPITMGPNQQYSSPKKNSKVWVMRNKTNYHEFWYFPMFQLNSSTFDMISGNTVQTEETEQSGDKESNKDGGKKVNEDDYADTDVLISRNGGPTGDVKVFSSPSRGIVLQLGSTTFINITKEGEILLTSDQVSLQVRDNKVFIGKEEYFEDSSKTQSAVLGENLSKLFSNLSKGLTELSTIASQNPFTMALCGPINNILSNLSTDVDNIIAENTVVN